jgi:putative transposase
VNQSKSDRHAMPVGEPIDQEVVSFRVQFNEKSPFGDRVREGARRMPQSAIDAEVEASSPNPPNAAMMGEGD